jgi:hypothetical protein
VQACELSGWGAAPPWSSGARAGATDQIFGEADLLQQPQPRIELQGVAQRISSSGVLCMLMFSLPLCKLPRACPSPQPPSPTRFSWWVISRGATFLQGECGIQPNVARVKTPSTAPGVTRLMESGKGTTLSPNLATQGPSVGKKWAHPLVATRESA